MERNGKKLAKRSETKRLQDFRCAWKNMSPESRRKALEYVKEMAFPIAPLKRQA